MTDAQYNETWRDFVNVNRASWNSAWLPLPSPRATGETIPDYAARCATWGDEPGGYREWHASRPVAPPPQPPMDSGSNSPPPPPPSRQ